MPIPDKYDGRPDIDRFDAWSYNLTNYMEFVGADDSAMIRVIPRLLTGTAEKFYLQYVARNPDMYTVKELLGDLFDYCFPDDFIEQMRQKWDKLTQGKLRVREYTREIADLAQKFPEMSERQVVLKLWNGLKGDIRGDLAMRGIDPEKHDINKIIRNAARSEKAQDHRKRQVTGDRQPEGGTYKPKREWTRFKSRNGEAKHFKPGNPGPEKPRTERVRANAMSPQNAPRERPKPAPIHHKLSRNKMDTLRAEGKCFNCQEKGHEQRNCPRLNMMKPPKSAVKAGSIRFAYMDKLAEMKDRADTYVGSMSIIEADPIMDKLREYEELELRVHQMCESAWGEDPLWYNEETRPDCKYSIEVNDEDVTIWDFVNGGSRTFERNELDNPEFDLAGIFSRPEPDRSRHWGQGVVYQTGTLQIHCKDMDKVLTHILTWALRVHS